jgi:mannosyltransferase OCH1-like enzyme
MIIILSLIIILLFIIIYIILKVNYNPDNILPSKMEFNYYLNYYHYKEYNYLKKNINDLLNYKMTINKLIEPRNDILISNNYKLIKNEDDFADYHFVIYYINDYKGKLIVRRLDAYKIEHLFKIKIYNNDNYKYQLIDINNNNKNEIIIEINTNIKLNKIIYKNTNIPKVIIQTGKDNKVNMANYNAIMTFIELNPEFTYIYYDDNDIITFLKSKFSKRYIDAYNKLIPGAYKADFFRYCFLYIYGGFYFDNKQINRAPINNFLNNQDLFLCRDRHDKFNTEQYYNALIFSIPNHLIMKQCIEKCTENIENNYYGKSSLDPTGPILLYQVAKNYQPFFYFKSESLKSTDRNLYHKSILCDYNDNIIANMCYKGYYDKEKQETYYNKYWLEKNIYKINYN